MEEYKLLEIIVETILYVPIILFAILFIICSILYASSKRFRKWSEEQDKRIIEWQEGYKKREAQRKFEKRLRRIEREIEKTGTYTPSRPWQYYAKRNGFMPWDD